MKAQLYTQEGSKKSQIELPSQFETKIREDLVQKFLEASREFSPYSHDPRAGRKHSASGTISHRRHEWKGQYGKGISRVPRKTMWRRGTQFFWIGAEVSGARGGRKVHGPRTVRRIKKVNAKEATFALNSALASTSSLNLIKKRYSTIQKLESAPFVIESLPNKTKALFTALRNIFPDIFPLILKKKTVRAGRGKTRGRKYKSNSGLLIIQSSEEKYKFSGLDIISLSDLQISDLFPLGRLVLYTEKAIKELGAAK